ncbi:MAG: DMT family transporter [Pseudomonadota bacterium]
MLWAACRLAKLALGQDRNRPRVGGGAVTHQTVFQEGVSSMGKNASRPNGLAGKDDGGTGRGRLFGIGLAALAAVFASSAGLLLRFAGEADPWVLLVYRALGFTVAVFLFVWWQQGRSVGGRTIGGMVAAFLNIGRPGIIVALSLGGAFIAFLLALSQTSVATVVAVLSLSPLFAAVISRVFLGERSSRMAWLSMAAALAGVVLVIWGDLASPSGLRLSPQGLTYAFLACLGYAIAIVGLRAGKAKDMSPATCLSGVVALAVSLLVCLIMIGSLKAAGHVVAIGLLLGTVQIGAQYILLTIATRYATAADVALVMILEIVLAPIWVWLFAGEAMPGLGVAGGVVIVAALIINTMAARHGEGS